MPHRQMPLGSWPRGWQVVASPGPRLLVAWPHLAVACRAGSVSVGAEAVGADAGGMAACMVSCLRVCSACWEGSMPICRAWAPNMRLNMPCICIRICSTAGVLALHAEDQDAFDHATGAITMMHMLVMHACCTIMQDWQLVKTLTRLRAPFGPTEGRVLVAVHVAPVKVALRGPIVPLLLLLLRRATPLVVLWRAAPLVVVVLWGPIPALLGQGGWSIALILGWAVVVLPLRGA